MPTLTLELRRELERAGDEPVRIDDPEAQDSYVLLKAEVYDRIKPLLGSGVPTEQVPEGIRRSKEAFLRDLPDLMARKRWHGRWVLYHGNERIGMARRPEKLFRECVKRRLSNDEFYLGVIGPHATELEEIEHSFYEFEEFESDT